VGALNRHLARLMSGRFYAAREPAKNACCASLRRMLDLARKLEEHAKGMVVPATLFEEFGFNYIGPIDGHDLESLIPTLQNIKELRGPQFLHVVTKKGRATSSPKPIRSLPRSRQVQSGRRHQAVDGAIEEDLHAGLRRMAVRRRRAGFAGVGITPAMREGSGMVEFEKRFPDRYFDVGIAEQHAVTFAGGLAATA
jgi:1-deoxy-D-xylulose-5-phosphate synthase